jgi:hypothetical protein
VVSALDGERRISGGALSLSASEGRSDFVVHRCCIPVLGLRGSLARVLSGNLVGRTAENAGF